MYELELWFNGQESTHQASTLESVADLLCQWKRELKVVEEYPIVMVYQIKSNETKDRILYTNLYETEWHNRENVLTFLRMDAKINEWENHRSQPTMTFPELEHNRWVDFTQVFPCFHYAPHSVIEHVQIPLERIYGDNWAFEKIEDRGRYPSTGKLRDLLFGYTGINNDYWFNKGRTIPPVYLYYIGDGYLLTEGNHRLYLSTLLKRDTLLADVAHYDYESFLQDSYLHPHYPAIVYQNRLLPIEEEQVTSYTLVKDYFRQQNELRIKDILALAQK